MNKIILFILPIVLLFVFILIYLIRPGINNEEYNIYLDVIQYIVDLERKINNETSEIYLALTTVSPHEIHYYSDKKDNNLQIEKLIREVNKNRDTDFEWDSETILKDFFQKNGENFVLSPEKFNGYKGLTLIDNTTSDSLLNSTNPISEWGKYFKKYPNSTGLLLFSRIGFDKGKYKALLYLEKYCGLNCGSGNYIFLSRDNSGWKVKDTYRMWEL